MSAVRVQVCIAEHLCQGLFNANYLLEHKQSESIFPEKKLFLSNNESQFYVLQ